MPIHASLSPAVIRSLEEPLVLAFDQPRNVPLVLAAFGEVDTWEVDQTLPTPSNPASLVGVFVGSLVGGKFLVSAVVLPGLKIVKPDTLKSPPQNFNGPVVKVKVDGDPATYHLPLVDNAENKEGGFFEILFGVAGSGGDLQNDPSAVFISKTPVFVRNVPHPRRVVTYVVSRGDGFLGAAAAVWKNLSDVFRKPPHTLASILTDVKTLSGTEPIGELNIVSHGNEFELFTHNLGSKKVVIGGFRRDDNVSIVVTSAQRSALPSPPDATIIDEKTVIVLRGCLVGQRAPLLDMVRSVFGGRGIVLGPNFLIKYTTVDTPNERLVESFFFFRPQKKPLSKKAAIPIITQQHQQIPASTWSSAGMDFEVRARFHQQTYTGATASAIINLNLASVTAGKKVTGFSSADNQALLGALSSIMKKQFKDDDMGTTFGVWGDWEFTIPGGLGNPNADPSSVISFQATGHRQKHEFRRELVERNPDDSPVLAGGKPVVAVPNLSNLKHFSRSPG